MGLPNINISFKTIALASVSRSDKGIVGLILKDANASAAGAHRMASASAIPAALGEDNAAYVRRAFLGYVTAPREVIAFVVADDATDLTAALAYFATVEVDYLCGPPTCTALEAAAIADWVDERREEHHTVKAVLPNQAADSEGIVNFTTTGIIADEEEYTPAEYCSRIAGLIAGTPMRISCTFAPLSEVTDIDRLSRAAMDAAIEDGEFILYHDGEKVKVGRGVNSLVTLTEDNGASFQKIKIVEAVDMIGRDIRRTCEDSYIGKYPNSYDSKCLLITAILNYFEGLERSGILQAGASTVQIDRAAHETWLTEQGIDVSAMTEQEIKEANTGDKVFLAASVKILDAIEDVAIDIVL